MAIVRKQAVRKIWWSWSIFWIGKCIYWGWL